MNHDQCDREGSAPEIVVPDLWGSKCEILDIGVVEGVAAALSELLSEERFHVKTWTNKGVQYSTASRRHVSGTSLPTHRGFPQDSSDCCYLAQQAADHRLVWMWYTIWFIQSLWLFSASPTANGIIELVTRWTCGITLAHPRNDPSRQKCNASNFLPNSETDTGWIPDAVAFLSVCVWRVSLQVLQLCPLDQRRAH